MVLSESRRIPPLVVSLPGGPFSNHRLGVTHQMRVSPRREGDVQSIGSAQRGADLAGDG
jgi:hypothetical protein